MLRAFRIFRDLVATQSFTKAASLNYLTQSAVSHHVRALEKAFGTRLVERGGGRVQLTQAGGLLFAASQELLKRYEQLERDLKHPSDEVSGRLQVGSIYTLGLYELPQHTVRFLKRYPKVALLLTYLKDAEVQEAVLADRIEVGIVDSMKPHPQLTTTFFKKKPVVLIASPKHPWVARKRIALAELQDQPFIVPQAEFPVEDILRGTRIRVKIVHAFENIEITKRAVEIGLGLAFVPAITVVEETRHGTLKVLPLAGGPFERAIGIITRKRRNLSLPAQKFIELLTTPNTPRPARA